MRNQSLEPAGRAFAPSEIFTDEFQRRANNLRMEIRRSQPRQNEREFTGTRLWDMRDIDELEWREHLRDDRIASAHRKLTPRLRHGLLRLFGGLGA
jgi:hypothetical protein